MYTNHFSKMLFETARFRLCCRSFKQRSCCRLSISCGIRRLTDKCTDRHWPDGLQIKKSRTGASDSSPAGGTLRLQNYQNANANHSHFGVTPTHPLNSHQSLSQSLGQWSRYDQLKWWKESFPDFMTHIKSGSFRVWKQGNKVANLPTSTKPIRTWGSILMVGHHAKWGENTSLPNLWVGVLRFTFSQNKQ